MGMLESAQKQEKAIDWELDTDIGPHPYQEDLKRLFRASSVPPKHEDAINNFLDMDDRKTRDPQTGEGENIRLLRQYYEYVRRDPAHYDKRDVINLLAQATEHAKNLQKIFLEYPELMRPYARIAPTVPQDPNDNRRYRNSRISATLNPGFIREKLDDNRLLAEQIVRSHQIITPEEPNYSAGNYEKTIARCFDGQVNIWGGVIEKQPGESWLRLRISPPSPFKEERDSWFETYEFSIKIENGLVDSPPLSHHQFENLGYLLYDESFRGIDEEKLLQMLANPAEATPEDWETWIEPYLDRQGLFGPKRD